MGVQTEIAKKLLQIKAIKLSPQKPFTWASGMQSPIYCDNRIALSFPEVRDFIIDAFVLHSKAYEEATAIAGVATAGIAHGALLADRLGLPFAYVRSKAKAHGRQNLIEGQLAKGAKVLVIEDLISTGGSSLQAVKALRDYGVEVLGTMAIFTYGFQKAADAFEQANCPLDTLTNYGVLVEQALRDQYINESELTLLKKWREAPESWRPA
ncbi:MAG TPA: orotate phosphoribosyltransferase [Saprospiraceae bacterium]|nr:orotate phosphoribosyltransferase [Saprospiraceae bacterium]